jgi:phage tail protein X
MNGETEALGGGKARAIVPLRLDILAKQLAGTERRGRIEAMLTANPGMAAQGPYVEAGRLVHAPARPEQDTRAVINPWE